MNWLEHYRRQNEYDEKELWRLRTSISEAEAMIERQKRVIAQIEADIAMREAGIAKRNTLLGEE